MSDRIDTVPPMVAAVPRDPAPPPTRLVEIRFQDLEGFAEDDHLAAFAAFSRSAGALAKATAPLRTALRPGTALRDLCRAVAEAPPILTAEAARRFFERHFTPYRIEAGEPGFLTGYYEPVIDGALEPSVAFGAPILSRPAGLDRLGPGVAAEPFLDRTAIEARIGSGAFKPVVWLRDWVEVFLVHVQGSARVRLPSGRSMRLVYDGRNGQPYTSIGRLLLERGEIAPDTMSLEQLKRWIREKGQEVGAPGRALMQCNRSYIFFRGEAERPGEGPIGGEGVPLSALRSIAVDRTLWSYGLPFFVEARLPWRGAGMEPFRRLMIAQDTGSAILGAARADLFFGAGEDAGRRAGDVRHRADMTVLLPHAGIAEP